MALGSIIGALGKGAASGGATATIGRTLAVGAIARVGQSLKKEAPETLGSLRNGTAGRGGGQALPGGMPSGSVSGETSSDVPHMTFAQVQGDNLVGAIDTMNKNIIKVGTLLQADASANKHTAVGIHKNNVRLDNIYNVLNSMRYQMGNGGTLTRTTAAPASNDNVPRAKAEEASVLGSILGGIAGVAIAKPLLAIAPALGKTIAAALATAMGAYLLNQMGGGGDGKKKSVWDRLIGDNLKAGQRALGMDPDSTGNSRRGGGQQSAARPQSPWERGGADRYAPSGPDSGLHGLGPHYDPTEGDPGRSGLGEDGFGLGGFRPQQGAGEGIGGVPGGMPSMYIQGGQLGMQRTAGGQLGPDRVRGMSTQRESNMRNTYEGFIEAGLTPEMAKAMTVHVGRENDFNSETLFGTHSDPHNGKRNVGMFSWQNGRDRGILEHLQREGHIDERGKIKRTPESIRSQAKYAMEEMQRDYPEVYKKITSGEMSFDEAVGVIGRKYVKWRADDPRYSGPGNNKMADYARKIGRLQESGTQTEGTQKDTNDLLPSPVDGQVGSPYGMRTHPITGDQRMHTGTDVRAARGTPLQMPADGIVVSAGEAGGYGNQVKVRLKDGRVISFSHMDSMDVRPGQQLKQGERVGAVGSTGRSTGPHAHIEVMDKNGNRIDPARVFGWNGRHAVRAGEVHGVKREEPVQIAQRGMTEFAGMRREERESSRAALNNQEDEGARPLTVSPAPIVREEQPSSEVTPEQAPTPTPTPSDSGTGNEVTQRSFDTSTAQQGSGSGGQTNVTNVNNNQSNDSSDGVDTRNVPSADWPFRSELKELFS